MANCFVVHSDSNFTPAPDDNVMDSIFKQYERVIVESLITSFGLDFLVNDRHGGDVDTIYSVRQINKDEDMTYKNKANQASHENRGEYHSSEYHSDKRYIEKNREIGKQKDAGLLFDTYTGEKIAPNAKSDLDHTISAKEIHDDRGRVLAGLKGTDLANSDENLNVTNPHTNRSKKADSMDEFLEKRGDEYNESQKTHMRQKDAAARKHYEAKLAQAYYTSPQFAKDITFAAGSVGVKMGLRQALGFVFAEIWFAVKEEFRKVGSRFDFAELLSAIGSGIKRGFENAKEKYRELFAKFREGIAAGALSSLTTTLCNIFFTTAKNVVKIIRQSYVSIVQAAKVLFINPDNLPFGERMRAIVKILATGASVVVGSVVMEALSKTPIGMIPVVGEVVQTFCGALVTGIMSCTLLYFFDRSELMNKLVCFLNNFHTIETTVDYFYRQAERFEEFAAKLMEIDIKKFQEEAEMFSSITLRIESSQNEVELNSMLQEALDRIGVKIPWEGDFGSFMSDKNRVGLIFS